MTPPRQAWKLCHYCPYWIIYVIVLLAIIMALAANCGPLPNPVSSASEAHVEQIQYPTSKADQEANWIVVVRHPPDATPQELEELRQLGLQYWSGIELLPWEPKLDGFGNPFPFTHQIGHSFYKRGAPPPPEIK